MHQKTIGREMFTVKRDDPLPTIGPGHIDYSKEQSFTNDQSGGKNLPFRQEIGPADTKER